MLICKNEVFIILMRLPPRYRLSDHCRCLFIIPPHYDDIIDDDDAFVKRSPDQYWFFDIK